MPKYEVIFASFEGTKMRKKTFFEHLITAMAALLLAVFPLLASCTKKEGLDNTSKPKSKVVIINLGHSMPLNTPLHQACLRLKDYVEKMSDKRIEMRVFGSSTLYSDKDMPEVLPAGILDMGICSPAFWSGTVPTLSIVALPTSSWEHMWNFIDDPQGISILDKECATKANCKYLGVFDCGAGDCQAFIKPVHKIEDFNGLKIRSSGESTNAVIRALGGSPSTISSAEMYEALQRGTIDGVQSTIIGVKGRNIQEVTPYLTRWTYLYAEFFALMNLDKWNSLPADLKEILKNGVHEQQLWSRKVIKTVIENAWDEIEKQPGVEVYVVPPDEAAKWEELSFAAVRDIFLKTSGEPGRQLLIRLKALRP